MSVGAFTESDVEVESGVMVRRTRRYDASLRARVSICAEHAPLVRLGPSSGAKDGWIEMDVVDFSAGGVGFVSLVWLPRRTILQFQLYAPGAGSDKAVVNGKTRVQRVTMTDRRPAYLLGTAFDSNTDPKIHAEMEALIAQFENEPD